MTKKNPFRFTIGFNPKDPSHVKTTNILNERDDKADIIAAAILNYMGEATETGIPKTDLLDLKSIVKDIVLQTIEETGVMQHQKDYEEIMQPIIPEEALQIDNEVKNNMADALKAFRKA